MSMFKSLIDNVKEMLYSEEYMKRSKIREEDFTRMRKMSFPDNVLLILKGTKRGLQAGLNEFFDSIEKDRETYTKQAFSKGRLRIKPEAFLELFKATVCKFYKEATIKTYRGYRVTAIDGSRYNLPNSPELRNIYGEQITKGQSQVQALTSCLYDVLNHMLMDVRIYPCKSNERIIAEEHLASLGSLKSDKYKELILLDRGYPSAQLIQRIESEGYSYVMRCSTEFLKAVKFSGSDSIVTHTFSSLKDTPISMRVIVLSLPNGSKEYFITNITDSSFTSEEFGMIYKMRWGIETKYDDLKNKLQIENFSGTSDIVIKQDFYSTMLLSNLAQSIIYDNGEEIVALHSSDDNKYSYAMNIAMTISELKTNFIKCFLCDNKIQFELEYSKMFNRLKNCVVPSNRKRNSSFPRTVAHRNNKFPQNKRYGSP